MHIRSWTLALSLLLAGAQSGPATPGEQRVLVQSTTSTENSGLFGYLLPRFTSATGIRVDVVAVGTGQAIRNAMNGDADLLLVHARQAEEAFVAAGYGVARHDLMYNDFVIVGPADDPAGIAGTGSLAEAMRHLARGIAAFVSRGDDSGTHATELSLWPLAGEVAFGSWYRETGSGMGATLRMAIEMDGYTIADRATWLAFGDRGAHKVLVEGYPELFNQYGVIVVNPAKHPHVNFDGARTLERWLLGKEGQALIAGFRVNGEQLFFPNAKPVHD